MRAVETTRYNCEVRLTADCVFQPTEWALQPWPGNPFPGAGVVLDFFFKNPYYLHNMGYQQAGDLVHHCSLGFGSNDHWITLRNETLNRE